MTFSNIDLEQVFSDFIEEFGGIVSDRLPEPPNNITNADYIFHEEKIVAELKLLREDPLQNKDFRKSIEKKQREWIQKGYITTTQLLKVTAIDQLPLRCYNDMVKLYSRPIKSHIEKANKQIKATKAQLKLDGYKGYVLLGSDGNYTLQPRHVRQIVAKILDNEDRHRSINTVTYFTANVMTSRPSSHQVTRLWVNLYRDKEHFENVPLKFLNSLYDGWVDHYHRATGISLDKLSNMNEEGITEEDLLKDAKLVRPPKRKGL